MGQGRIRKWGPTKNSKINTRGGNLIFGTGEYIVDF